MGRKYLGWLLRRSPGDWPFLFLYDLSKLGYLAVAGAVPSRSSAPDCWLRRLRAHGQMAHHALSTWL